MGDTNLLQELQSLLDTLCGRKSVWERRKKKLLAIRADMDRKLGDDASISNKFMDQCQNSAFTGCKGFAFITSLQMGIDEKKEEAFHNDIQIASCRINISKEINRCDSEIDSLSGQITSARCQINGN